MFKLRLLFFRIKLLFSLFTNIFTRKRHPFDIVKEIIAFDIATVVVPAVVKTTRRTYDKAKRQDR